MTKEEYEFEILGFPRGKGDGDVFGYLGEDDGSGDA